MKNEKIRVFEAFAGIGAQHSALSRLKIPYEIVGTSEWFINALLVYSARHPSKKKIVVPSKEEQIQELSRYTFSKDSVHPIKSLSSLKDKEIEELYIANKTAKNFGSILDIHGKNLPAFDLLIYSFPCQDLSTGGKTLGRTRGSGTRSSLIWEIQRILLELKEVNRLPEYLLMENVKAIYAKSNQKDFDAWLSFLESLGYKNGSHLVLNAINFGVPQHRERAFIISHLGEKPIPDEELVTYSKPQENVKDFLRLDYSDEELKKEADQAQLNRTPSREKMWEINGRSNPAECPFVNTITCNRDRSNTAARFPYNGPKGNTYRLLTIREAFLLRGFTEQDYIRAKSLGISYRKRNKLIGNSIVVNVLQAVFATRFSDKFKKKKK